jgi:ERCC4-type nuclease
MPLDKALTILIDTREQQPLDFCAPYIKETLVEKLHYGDYSCRLKDEVCPVFFERKSLSDLFGTLGAGRERFKNECDRCIKNNHKLIIIVEKPLKAIHKGARFSCIAGLTIIRTLFTLAIKYNIDFVCCNNRAESSLYIAEFYYSYFKNLEYLKEHKEEICQEPI